MVLTKPIPFIIIFTLFLLTSCDHTKKPAEEVESLPSTTLVVDDQQQVLHFRIDGMTCPTKCVGKARKALSSISDATEIVVDMPDIGSVSGPVGQDQIIKVLGEAGFAVTML